MFNHIPNQDVLTSEENLLRQFLKWLLGQGFIALLVLLFLPVHLFTQSTQSLSDAKSLLATVQTGNLEQVRELIKRGVDIDGWGPEGNTPLIEALHIRQVAIARLLIEQGADINRSGKDGHSPLMKAARRGLPELAELLVKRGAAINHTSDDGHTALMLAAEHGHYEVAAFLIEQGADVNTTTQHGWTALRYASAECRWRIAELIMDSEVLKAEDNLKNGQVMLFSHED